MKQGWWRDAKAAGIEIRKVDADRYLAKAFELANDGDYEAAERFFGYAMHQVERVFCARKGFRLATR